jgi:NTP pyrophosphatase (non-canonical NTP hydrolase)
MKMSKWVPESNQMVLRRVGKTGEECSELSKVCNRIVIQGLHSIDPSSGLTNIEELAKEVADVIAQCEVTIKMLHLPRKFIEDRVAKKVELMAEWESLFDPIDPEFKEPATCRVCGTSDGLRMYPQGPNCDGPDCVGF